MTETAIEAWPETLKVLAEAETVTELNARLVGLLDVFKEADSGDGGDAAKILKFLENKHASVFQNMPPGVASNLRAALDRMAPHDLTAKELLAKL